MKKSSKSLVFFGSGAIAAASLENLKDSFPIEFVITKNKRHYLDSVPVEELAKKLKLKVLFADSQSELKKLFDNLRPKSACGLVIDYGVIIDQKIIDLFDRGIVNSHFSLLPEWRGPDPITFALLSGQDQTGVSFMQIADTIDTGQIIAESILTINGDETAVSLTKRLIKASNGLINAKLTDYINDNIELKPQKNGPLTYSRKLHKADGRLVWSKPASVLEREIRAYNVWPKSYYDFKNLKVTIIKTKSVSLKLKVGQIKISDDSKQLIIGCLKDSLEILELKPAGKNNMPATDFLNGYKQFLL